MPPDSARVERYFHRTAVDFDSLYEERNTWTYRVNRLLRAGLFERVRLTVAQFQDLSDFDVLDVGCGSGRNSIIFAQAAVRNVVGIDFADNMIELARQTSNRHGFDARCEFIRGDVFTHQFVRRFDVVVALGVFDYIAEPEKLMSRMMELSSGKVIGSFPAVSPLRAPLRKLRYALRNCPVYFYTRSRLEEMCERCGLRDHTILSYASSGFIVVGRVDR
jgi:2-polyprenyl-3-methyl-5-hydroxy-6-metoxy-1,4-benzoquinol methylase